MVSGFMEYGGYGFFEVFTAASASAVRSECNDLAGAAQTVVEIVGGEDDGRMSVGVAYVPQCLQYIYTVFSVKEGRRFVQQYDGRLPCECGGNCGFLELSVAEGRYVPVGKMSQLHTVHRCIDRLLLLLSESPSHVASRVAAYPDELP